MDNASKNEQKLIDRQNKNSLNIEKVKELFDSDFSEAFTKYKEGNLIWCVEHNMWSDYAFMSTPKSRKPYQSIIEKLCFEMVDAWEKYPKRCLGFIGMNSHVVDAYTRYNSSNMLMLAFPKNNSKIAIASNLDFNTSFENFEEDIYDRNASFSSSLVLLCSSYTSEDEDVISTYIRNASKNNLIKMFKNVEMNINKKFKNGVNTSDIELLDLMHPSFSALIDQIVEKQSTDGHIILEFINKVLNPDFNKFKLTDIANYGFNETHSTKHHEVWFDETTLFVSLNMMNKL